MIDACSRATILDMLLNLRNETGMTIIFITHDIGLAYYISDSIYIMEHGKFVESGSADEVILHPKAAYTRRLISDVPKIHEAWGSQHGLISSGRVSPIAPRALLSPAAHPHRGFARG